MVSGAGLLDARELDGGEADCLGADTAGESPQEEPQEQRSLLKIRVGVVDDLREEVAKPHERADVLAEQVELLDSRCVAVCDHGDVPAVEPICGGLERSGDRTVLTGQVGGSRSASPSGSERWVATPRHNDPGTCGARRPPTPASPGCIPRTSRSTPPALTYWSRTSYVRSRSA